jgi:predicted membrane metal-binding protein
MKNVFWKNAVATTLAAQIAVLPLLLYDTGNLSWVAVPANLITMPVVPLAMGLSVLAGFAGIIFNAVAPILGFVLGYPAYLANAFLIYVAQKAAELPFATFTLPLFPFWFVLVTYATLIFIASSKRFSTTLQLKFAKKASI